MKLEEVGPKPWRSRDAGQTDPVESRGETAGRGEAVSRHARRSASEMLLKRARWVMTLGEVGPKPRHSRDAAQTDPVESRG